MNAIGTNGSLLLPHYEALRLGEFEVSWVGPSPLGAGFCFGAVDGRLLFTDDQGHPVATPMQGSPSGEAVNGVASFGEWLAISTRSEIAMGSIGQGDNRVLIIPSGAHGVVASVRGFFVAPLGRAGVLVVRVGSRAGDPLGVLTTNDPGMHFYRLVILPGTQGLDMLAVAARAGGLAIAETDWNGGKLDLRVAQFSNHDVIDICAVPDESGTSSIAALARDGTVIFVRDGLHGEPVTTRFQAIQGTGFRIMSDGNHVVVVTSRAVHVLANLATELLIGRQPGSFKTRILTMPLDVVDANLVNDHWLMLILDNEVRRLDLRTIRVETSSNWCEGQGQAHGVTTPFVARQAAWSSFQSPQSESSLAAVS